MLGEGGSRDRGLGEKVDKKAGAAGAGNRGMTLYLEDGWGTPSQPAS